MWDALPVNDSRKGVKIIVSFDMGWQRRGFFSLSGHAFMIGGRTKKILTVLCVQRTMQNVQEQRLIM